MMLELRPIKTETDYRAALHEIERLFDAEPDTPEFDRLDILTTRFGSIRTTALPN